MSVDPFDTIQGAGTVRHLSPTRVGSCLTLGNTQQRAATVNETATLRPCHLCEASILGTRTSSTSVSELQESGAFRTRGHLGDVRSRTVIDASHWNIPDDWRAPAGAVTPDKRPAQFRSAAHAVMAVRIHFLNTHPQINAEPVVEVIARYRNAWDLFSANCRNVVAVANHVDNNDLGAAADVWKSIDQPAVDKAFAIVMGEREPYPTVGGRSRNLSTLARAAFLPNSPTEKASPRRKLTDRDSNDAWDRSPGGRCVSCCLPTTRTSQHRGLHRLFRSNPVGFDLEPSYTDTKGIEVPLWSARILIAAKGTPDHVIAVCRGGLNSPENLANTCAACQFARGNWTLDDLSVPVYGAH